MKHLPTTTGTHDTINKSSLDNGLMIFMAQGTQHFAVLCGKVG